MADSPKPVVLPVLPIAASGTVRGSTKLPVAGTLKYAYVRVAGANITTSSQWKVVQGAVGATIDMTSAYTTMNTNTNVEQILQLTLLGTTNVNVTAGTRVAIELVATGATCLVTNAEAYLWFGRPAKVA